MTRTVSLLMAAGGFAIASSIVMAAPPSGAPSSGGGMHGPSSTTTASPQSPTGNGGGYNHQNAPQHTTGQPMQSCETTGSPPGGSASAPGSAFNPDGTAGTKYAGTQAQNQRNTASVSQYDVACSKQPH